jgi:hypothetical protein
MGMTKEGWKTRRANGNNVPWNKGRKMPEITGSNNSRYSRIQKACKLCGQKFAVKAYRKYTAQYCSHGCAHSGRLIPENKVDYHALHKWVNFHLGQPLHCDLCGFESLNRRQFDWSNIDHMYKRNLEDWIRLCKKCHRAFDRRCVAVA